MQTVGSDRAAAIPVGNNRRFSETGERRKQQILIKLFIFIRNIMESEV